jgi:hypothetical protein
MGKPERQMMWWVASLTLRFPTSANDYVQINFLSMDDTEVEGAKSNLLRTLGAAAS